MRTLLRMAVAPGLVMLCAASQIVAQSLTTPTVISQHWVRTQILEADVYDTTKSGWHQSWQSIRSRPEVVTALIAIHNDSTVPRLERLTALSFLGATGQPSAYEYLEHTFDDVASDLETRVSVIYGMGSIPHSDTPPEGVFQRLAIALSSGPPRQRIAAAYALGDLHSARADLILRKRRAAETSVAVLQRIDRNLARSGPH